MKTEMTRCDHQACDSVTDDIYGWIVGDLTIVGHGPTVHLEVCSSACLSDGFDDACARQEHEEYLAEEIARERLEVLTLSANCDTCGASAGQACVTKNGTISQEWHAPRRHLARKLMHEEKIV